MIPDLNSRALIGFGSGFLFAILGAVALATTRRSRATVPFAFFAIPFGVSWVVLLFEDDPLLDALDGTLSAISAVALAFLLARLPNSDADPPSHRRIAWAIALASGVGLMTLAWRNNDGASLDLYTAAGINLSRAAILGSMALLALRASRTAGARDRHAQAALAIGICSWVVFGSGSALWELAQGEWPQAVVSMPFALAVAGLWLYAGERTRDRALVAAGVAFAALALAGMLSQALVPAPFGAPGIARTLTIPFLAYAVFAGGILGGEQRGPASLRGAWTATALAALFIVAQVAQNFLSAQYGLLMGGLVAGALLVAARPIERALERRAPEAPGASSGKLATYRTAARYVLRDGRVTRAEEVHLAELAQHLGIGAADAVRARHEVEDEHGRA